jgi:hypothetical protein
MGTTIDRLANDERLTTGSRGGEVPFEIGDGRLDMFDLVADKVGVALIEQSKTCSKLGLCFEFASRAASHSQESSEVSIVAPPSAFGNIRNNGQG